ncbi:MAG: hypoxanthine phosphoribosyltransferase [bacterium]|nr:hypoxanthine phosphoribosyltransferase [bacterium]
MSTVKNPSIRRVPFEIMLDQKTIGKRVTELGRELTRDYNGRLPIMLGVLKGCLVFMADLIRAVDIPLEVEFVSAASYRKGSKPQDNVVLRGASTVPLKNRHVLLIEGIVDSGKTVRTILKELERQEPASVEIVTLLDKPASHRSTLDIKYKGFSIGNEFVIGYGLDNTQKYRNLPFIGRVLES